jgi:Fe2+ or Zn2+ uptake regulation protein
MCQDLVLAMISAFGPISSTDILNTVRMGHDSVYRALRVMSHTGEIIRLEHNEPKSRSFWVVP